MKSKAFAFSLKKKYGLIRNMTYRNYFLWLWPLLFWTVTEILVLFNISNCVGTQLSRENNTECLNKTW